MNDICFVIAPQNKGWILDRIAHEIGGEFKYPIYHYGTENIPKAERYFALHYTLLPAILQQVNPDCNQVSVFFTHESVSIAPMVDTFNLCKSVIAENAYYMNELLKIGVRPDKLHFVPECSNTENFKPHARTGNGSILFSGKNYKFGRKNAPLINEVAKLLPHRNFISVGPEWERDVNGPNVKHMGDIPYSEYPKVYEECDVYLTASTIEGGGPNSLIESMHCNMVPVASDCGNACDYIVDGYNGYIFPIDATAEQVAELIEKAYKLAPQNAMPYADIWQTVKQFTWDTYRIQMKEAITGDYSKTSSQELMEQESEGLN